MIAPSSSAPFSALLLALLGLWACKEPLPECGKGTTSCNDLGLRYETGKGVPRDLVVAAKLYEKGCNGGEADACTSFGRMAENEDRSGGPLTPDGKGDANDFLKARVPEYQANCDGGDARSCSALGDMYASGMGVPKDEKKAHELHVRACAGGEKTSCTK